MITAIDANILLDILILNEDFCDAAEAELEEAASGGPLAICGIAHVELCVHFEHQRDCDAFLEANEIRVQALSSVVGKTCSDFSIAAETAGWKNAGGLVPAAS